MSYKYVAAAISVLIFLGYVGPIVWKLQEPAIAVVVLIGIVMLLVDLWQSLQSKSD